MKKATELRTRVVRAGYVRPHKYEALHFLEILLEVGQVVGIPELGQFLYRISIR